MKALIEILSQIKTYCLLICEDLDDQKLSAKIKKLVNDQFEHVIDSKIPNIGLQNVLNKIHEVKPRC